VSKAPFDAGPSPWPTPTPPIIAGPSETIGSGQAAREATRLATGNAIPLVYGRLRVGGDLFWFRTEKYGSSNQFMRVIAGFIISHGPIEDIESVVVGEVTQPLTAGSWEAHSAGPTANNYLESCWTFKGELTQTISGNAYLAAISALVGNMPGIAIAVCLWDTQFQTKLQWPMFVVKGRKIYDPRTATTAYSSNPALILADIKRSKTFGDAVPDADIDLDHSVWAAATYCDAAVYGPTARANRSQCHLQLREVASGDDWARTIGTHAGLRWQYVGGLWKQIIHGPNTMTPIAITADDIVGEPTLRRGLGAGLRDLPNRVTIEWTDVTTWKVAQALAFGDEVTTGGEVREGGTYKLHGITVDLEASDAAWRMFNQMQADLGLSVQLMPKHAGIQQGDIIAVTLPTLGMSARTFAVTGVTRGQDDSVNVDALDYRTAVFDPGPISAMALDADPDPIQPWANLPTPILYTRDWTHQVRVTDTPALIVDNQMPAVWFERPDIPPGKEPIACRVRAATWSGSGPEPSWADMAAAEFRIPTGNGQNWASGSGTLVIYEAYHEVFSAGTKTYNGPVYSNGQWPSVVTSVAPWVVEMRWEFAGGFLSAGIRNVQATAVSTTVTGTPPAVPAWGSKTAYDHTTVRDIDDTTTRHDHWPGVEYTLPVGSTAVSLVCRTIQTLSTPAWADAAMVISEMVFPLGGNLTPAGSGAFRAAQTLFATETMTVSHYPSGQPFFAAINSGGVYVEYRLRDAYGQDSATGQAYGPDWIASSTSSPIADAGWTPLVIAAASGSVGGDLEFLKPGDATKSTTLRGGSPAASFALTLPVADGTTGQAVVTNGSGVLSFATPAAGPTGPTGATGAAGANGAIGSVVAHAAATAPTNWLICDGSSLLRAGTYAGLFAVIGTTWGSVGSTTFKIPDLRGRFLLGKAASGTGSTFAGTGGAIDHAHGGYTADVPYASGSNTDVTYGGDQRVSLQSHFHAISADNPPFAAVIWIIRYA
jgi:microcystin-dependent protein